MTPKFQILVAGLDVTSVIGDRLLSLKVTDEAGAKADALDVELDNRDGKIVLPPTGAPISVSMGYKESGLIPMGLYTASEITLQGPPDRMSIRAKSANMSGSLREQKSRTWDEKTVKDIVETIAAEHELTAKVADQFAEFTYEALAQTDESDLHFLNRLSKEQDAMLAIKGGLLLFGTRGLGLSLSGLLMPQSLITKGDVSTWRATLADADDYGSVKAKWHNDETGEQEVFTQGEGEPAKALRNVFKTEAEAQRAALAEVSKIKRAGHKLSISMAAKPELAAESQITLLGFGAGADGTWSITSAVHELKGSGFTTRLSAERPQS